MAASFTAPTRVPAIAAEKAGAFPTTYGFCSPTVPPSTATTATTPPATPATPATPLAAWPPRWAGNKVSSPPTPTPSLPPATPRCVGLAGLTQLADTSAWPEAQAGPVGSSAGSPAGGGGWGGFSSGRAAAAAAAATPPPPAPPLPASSPLFPAAPALPVAAVEVVGTLTHRTPAVRRLARAVVRGLRAAQEPSRGK
jgi:hypothetical protein